MVEEVPSVFVLNSPVSPAEASRRPGGRGHLGSSTTDRDGILDDVSEQWIEVAWLEPATTDTDRKAEIISELDRWCARRGISRESIPEAAIRINLQYLGPHRGTCATQILIDEAQVPPAP